jgi:DNA helicase-2/ATP-dependent DNA helicase PcrA
MEHPGIFEGLSPAQKSAVEALRGPVCILAGAGTGKTTTVTRRIANQVASGAVEAGSILAVTFTDKAAREMRGRLQRLKVEGVRARTFHSAALAQLRYMYPEPIGRILNSKGLALRQIGNSLPKPYRFRPASDLATEIEWAKNRRIAPTDYLASLGPHQPPVPPDVMLRVYRRYEEGKQKRGLIDFEDLLELTIRMYDRDPSALEMMRERYSVFTVDEYQDVNLLQQTLLQRWLGERDDLCAVGDDYQSIYGFTGASASHLLDMPKVFSRCQVFKLEENHRSTPEVLEVANRLVPDLGGAEKILTAVRPSGPKPSIRRFVNDPSLEISYLVDQIKKLAGSGVPYEEMAILYRVNFRSEEFEEALAEAQIPYQVRDGSFLGRQAARRLLASLRKMTSTAIAEEVTGVARRQGWDEAGSKDASEAELTRQKDLTRLVALASEADDGTQTVSGFIDDLRARFGGDDGARGVNLLTYHRSKGLEFEAVFLPRILEGELPFKRSSADEAVDEERRLFYVGITRAKTHLHITCAPTAKNKASRFFGESAAGARRGSLAASG